MALSFNVSRLLSTFPSSRSSCSCAASVGAFASCWNPKGLGRRYIPSFAKRRVVAILQLPPPVMGLSVVNAAMVERIAGANLLMSVFDIGGGKAGGKLLKIMRRALRVVTAIPYLILCRIKGARVLYMSPDKGRGLLINIMLSSLARILGFRIYLHHHNYVYVSNHLSAMNLLLKCSPRNTMHIFLCDKMDSSFQAKYRAAWNAKQHRSIVVSNAFILGEQPELKSIRADIMPMTIGHLSNLTIEKGLQRFLDLFAACSHFGPVNALIAGPADDKVAAIIDEAVRSSDGRLNWLGPIYDTEKETFYNSIDVFVMPTAYINEAQPLVLIEALAHGVPVMATDIGCIGCDHVTSPGYIAPIESFVEDAARWLETRRVSGNSRIESSLSARTCFEQMRRASENEIERCLTMLRNDSAGAVISNNE
jgi:glycosyltransferase involved in cell wall biosynthesis